jgi:hypothetical protein
MCVCWEMRHQKYGTANTRRRRLGGGSELIGEDYEETFVTSTPSWVAIWSVILWSGRSAKDQWFDLWFGLNDFARGMQSQLLTVEYEGSLWSWTQFQAATSTNPYNPFSVWSARSRGTKIKSASIWILTPLVQVIIRRDSVSPGQSQASVTSISVVIMGRGSKRRRAAKKNSQRFLTLIRFSEWLIATKILCDRKWSRHIHIKPANRVVRGWLCIGQATLLFRIAVPILLGECLKIPGFQIWSPCWTAFQKFGRCSNFHRDAMNFVISITFPLCSETRKGVTSDIALHRYLASRVSRQWVNVSSFFLKHPILAQNFI